MSLLFNVASGINGAVALGAQMGRMFYREPYTIGDVQTEMGVEIDSVIDEGHNSQSTVTTYPVEYGADMSDHMQDQPRTVTLNCLMSDVSSNELVDFGLTGAAGSLARDITGDRNTRSAQAWKQIEALKSRHALITLVTQLKTYTNMAIISLSNTRNKDNTQALFFQVGLQEVRIIDFNAQGSSISVAPPAKPETAIASGNQGTADKMSPQVNGGELKQGSTATGSESSSLLKSSFDFFAG